MMTTSPGRSSGTRTCSTNDSKMSPFTATIHHRRTADAFDAQSSNQRRRLPVAMWGLVDEPLTTWGTTTQSCHVRLGPDLIDEDQPPGILLWLVARPRFTPLSNIWFDPVPTHGSSFFE